MVRLYNYFICFGCFICFLSVIIKIALNFIELRSIFLFIGLFLSIPVPLYQSQLLQITLSLTLGLLVKNILAVDLVGLYRCFCRRKVGAISLYHGNLQNVDFLFEFVFQLHLH